MTGLFIYLKNVYPAFPLPRQKPKVASPQLPIWCRGAYKTLYDWENERTFFCLQGHRIPSGCPEMTSTPDRCWSKEGPAMHQVHVLSAVQNCRLGGFQCTFVGSQVRGDKQSGEELVTVEVQTRGVCRAPHHHLRLRLPCIKNQTPSNQVRISTSHVLMRSSSLLRGCTAL